MRAEQIVEKAMRSRWGYAEDIDLTNQLKDINFVISVLRENGLVKDPVCRSEIKHIEPCGETSMDDQCACGCDAYENWCVFSFLQNKGLSIQDALKVSELIKTI